MRAGVQGYRWRLLTPYQVDAIREAHAEGASLRALADSYGCSYRTLYRAVHRRESEQIVTVALGDYCATFAIGDEGPIQLGPWVPKLSEAVA